MEALLLDLQRELPFFQNRKQAATNQIIPSKLVSIYFGGGTPSLFQPSRIEKVICAALEAANSSTTTIPAPQEITLEINPERHPAHELQAYFWAGVNRLSIGVQSFHDKELAFLGRTHSSQDILQTISVAEKVGFKNISIDLMYELPNQSREEWFVNLKTAASLPITHLSLYNLQIEEGSLYFKQKEKIQYLLPGDETGLWMYETAQEVLTAAGFVQYEISAFARPGYQSLHNSGYWVGREFLGIGPSAWSFMGNQRSVRIPNIQRYIQALVNQESPVESQDMCDPCVRRKELLVVGLRLFAGVFLPDFEAAWGSLESETLHQIERLKQDELLTGTTQLKLTPRGRVFYDYVASALI